MNEPITPVTTNPTPAAVDTIGGAAGGAPEPTTTTAVPVIDTGVVASSVDSVAVESMVSVPASIAEVQPSNLPQPHSPQQTQLDTHEARNDNPHNVTLEQLGAASASVMEALEGKQWVNIPTNSTSASDDITAYPEGKISLHVSTNSTFGFPGTGVGVVIADRRHPDPAHSHRELHCYNGEVFYQRRTYTAFGPWQKMITGDENGDLVINKIDVQSQLLSRTTDLSNPDQVLNVGSVALNDLESTGIVSVHSKVTNRDYSGNGGTASSLDDMGATKFECSVGAGTDPSAWGACAFGQNVNTFPTASGSHISCAKPMTLAGIAVFQHHSASMGSNRITIGATNSVASAPPVSGNDALSAKGWGMETRIINGVNSLVLFAHDGSTFLESTPVANPLTNLHGTTFILHKEGGTIRLWTAPNGTRVDTSLAPKATLTGAPATGYTQGDYFTVCSTGDGVNPPLQTFIKMKDEFKIAQNVSI